MTVAIAPTSALPQIGRAVLQRLKHFRAIATRFEKPDANYLARIKLASA
jgi:hypothetical protein